MGNLNKEVSDLIVFKTRGVVYRCEQLAGLNPNSLHLVFPLALHHVRSHKLIIVLHYFPLFEFVSHPCCHVMQRLELSVKLAFENITTDAQILNYARTSVPFIMQLPLVSLWPGREN